ncbi:MAG: hypothetical protein R2707_13270 [Acidimicrobiales bacterium]
MTSPAVGAQMAGQVSRAGDRWNLAAIAAAFAFALAISLLPLVSESSDSAQFEPESIAEGESVGAGPEVVSESTRRSLLETEGARIVAIALVPALVAAVPMLCRPAGVRRKARLVASLVLGVVAVLGAASVGLFVVPTLIMMVVATSRSPGD